MRPTHARARTPGRTPGARFNSDEALLRQPVEIYCRIRPIDEAEERCTRVLDDKTLEITPPGSSLAVRSQTQNAKSMQYTFTKVFDETADQKEVFDQTAKSLVFELLKGRNGLLFAYGNTGSGKTHTMTGHNRDGGLLPRSVDVLFNSISLYLATPNTFRSDKMNSFDVLSPVDALAETSKDRVEKAQFPPRTPSRNRQDAYESKESRTEDLSILSGVDSDCLYGVFVTYVEIYNNSVFDLLENQPADSRAKAHFQTKVLREDSSRRMYVHNATQLEVRNADEALEAFKHGQKRRRVAQTTLNAESSRSHSVFTIRLVQASLSGSAAEVVDKNTMTVSQLSLVDLAGCERTSRTNTKGDRLKEAGNINNTLMTLRNCIEVLRENQLSGANKIVPYRDSKITHIFKSYFEGEGKIKMVVCVNPRAEDFDETVLVFRFAEMAREVSIPIEPKPLPPPRPEPYIPGRRKQNHFQEEIDRITREDRPNFDQNVVFSLGTFPPHELSRNADIQEILTNLESHLQHRIDTRSQLSANIMSRRTAFRNRLVALENDSHKQNFEVDTLKGQLDAEITKFQEEIDKITREDRANFDQNVVFSLGTFPPQELSRNADIQEILTNLEGHLQHRIDTRSQLSANIMSRRTAFRNRLVALENDGHKQNFEVDTLKGQLDAEITKRGTRRKREDSGSSLRSDDRNSNTPDSELSAPSISTRSNTPEVARPGKRKCSENASELIKACIGADDRRKSGLLGESAEIDKESNKKKTIEPRKSSETNRASVFLAADLKWFDLPTPKRADRKLRRDRNENFRQRRSKSAGGEKWLDHRSPGVSVPLGTVFKPLMRKRKLFTELGSSQDVGNCDRYALTRKQTL